MTPFLFLLALHFLYRSGYAFSSLMDSDRVYDREKFAASFFYNLTWLAASGVTFAHHIITHN